MDPAPVLPVLIVAVLLLALVAGYPRHDVPAPLRLACLRAMVVTAAFGVVTVEVLSALGHLTTGGMFLAWAGAFAGFGVAAAVRLMRGPVAMRPRLAAAAGALRGPDWLLVAGVGCLVLLELAVTVIAPPNTYDSQTYHLPRIEHWVQRGSVEFYPTAVDRQASLGPGAEYLLLVTRLLSGGDRWYNLLQWSAGVGCLLAVARLAAQLGARARGQLVAAATVGTAPMVVLQASSTQTDLTVACWTVVVATVAVDGWRRRARLPDVLWLGTALGLVVLTKATGALVVGPVLVLWGVAQLRLACRVAVGAAVTGGAALLVIALTAAMAGPFMLRVHREWGHPLVTPSLRETTLARHDPAAVAVNAARVAATVAATPSPQLNDHLNDAARHLADRLGVAVNDPDITYRDYQFPARPVGVLDEDQAPFPIQALGVLAAVVFALAGRRRPGTVRHYATAVAVGLILVAATVAWQPWVSRLLLPVLALGAPVVGWWAGRMVEPPAGRRDACAGIPAAVAQVPVPALASAAAGHVAAAGPDPAPAGTRAVSPRPAAGGRRRYTAALLVTGTVIAMAGGWAGKAAVDGAPRPMRGKHSIVHTGEWQVRFARGRLQLAPYQAAAAEVLAVAPRRVGLLQGGNDREYFWWRLLRAGGHPPEIVNLTSALPRHPAPPAASVDAIVCTLSPPGCRRRAPAGWRLREYTDVTVMLPQR